MTHDELLAKINLGAKFEGATWSVDGNLLIKQSFALRKIVELHKPEQGVIESWFKWLNGTKIIGCRLCDELYPCPTIQAIEKELT